ncbi:MAG: CvpA family protein, partial [Candidatus Aminicenantales bacterium]
MELNWLDILLLVILGITVIIGAVKGFIRQVVGLAAVIVGLLLALRYYEEGARAFGFISSETLSQLLGFWLIFFGVLLLGWLVNRLLAKAAKGPLKSMNHFLGAGLGFVKGLLICGVVVFGLIVFPVDEKALKASRLAPY